jgi:hypothetical protein
MHGNGNFGPFVANTERKNNGSNQRYSSRGVIASINGITGHDSNKDKVMNNTT